MSNCAVQALKDRRSIRAYDPNRQVPEELLQEILQVAMNSPTAHNKQKYHFTVVQEPALLEHMADLIRQVMLNGTEEQRAKASKPGYSPLHHAPTVIVITGQLDGFNVQTDCGIAAGMISAAAEHLGLGACVVGSSVFMFKTEESAELKKTLQIPESHSAVCTVTLGYLAGDKPAPPAKKSAEELISFVR